MILASHQMLAWALETLPDIKSRIDMSLAAIERSRNALAVADGDPCGPQEISGPAAIAGVGPSVS